MSGLKLVCAAAFLGLAALGTAFAQLAFPYDRDMVLDARAMRGGKRVPILSIEAGGRAQIDLWCKRGEGQAAIAGDTITIVVGAMKDEPCTPERAQADEELLGVLAQVTGWSLRGDVMTLNGARPLRFRLATN
jgi:heat shock protein HslJ